MTAIGGERSSEGPGSTPLRPFGAGWKGVTRRYHGQLADRLQLLRHLHMLVFAPDTGCLVAGDRPRFIGGGAPSPAPTTPLRIHGADPVETVPSPKLGQHNREIYGEPCPSKHSARSCS